MFRIGSVRTALLEELHSDSSDSLLRAVVRIRLPPPMAPHKAFYACSGAWVVRLSREPEGSFLHCERTERSRGPRRAAPFVDGMLFYFCSISTYTTARGQPTMSTKQPETTLKFEIKSLDSSQPILDAVPVAEGLASELEAILRDRYPGATVTIRRAEGIPGARELQELLVHVDWHVVKTGVESTVASFATTEFLKLMKAKLRNIFVKPLNRQGSEAGEGKTLPLAKKKAPKPGSSRPKKKSRLSKKDRKR